MKTEFWIGSVLVCLVGCTPDLSGAYEDVNGSVRYEFIDTEHVFITSLGITVRGTYRVEDGTVYVTSPQGVYLLEHEQEYLVTAAGLPLHEVPLKEDP